MSDEEDVPIAVLEGTDGRTAGQQNGKTARQNGRVIVEIGEEWMVHDEWWRSPIARRYFDVVMDDGAHLVLFKDLTTNQWYLQTP